MANTNTNVASTAAYIEGTYKPGDTSRSDKGNYATINWGTNASRTIYNNFSSYSANNMQDKNLLNSRLWLGVPQLSRDQLHMFEAAYTGHTFIFVVDVPKFMTTGYYANTNLHQHMKNLKAVIERASTGISGFSNITAMNSDVDDGSGRKISHITSVTKEQQNISLRLHEFAGLPVKNALEAWLTGIFDYRSQHGNYHGNLGIPGGWCLANHSMSLLVVQVTPDWTTIQDAVYLFNMVPTEVPFMSFEWQKGEQNIVEDYDIEFICNEERSPAIMYAAEKYMNNRILSMVATSVFNQRQFVAYDGSLASNGIPAAISGSSSDANAILDKNQYSLQYGENNPALIADANANAGAKLNDLTDYGSNGQYMVEDTLPNASSGSTTTTE